LETVLLVHRFVFSISNVQTDPSIHVGNVGCYSPVALLLFRSPFYGP